MADFIILSRKAGPDKDPDAVFVRDGFSVLAALFPVFWLLWHRAWLWALAVFAFFLVAAGLSDNPALEAATGLFALGTGLFFGLEGRQIAVRNRLKRGFQIRAVISAPDQETAERLYFGNAQMTFASPPTKQTSPAAPARQGHGVGVFDSDGGI